MDLWIVLESMIFGQIVCRSLHTGPCSPPPFASRSFNSQHVRVVLSAITFKSM
jgi:hypothetical protein